MPYLLAVEENIRKKLAKASAKNPEFKKAVDRKLEQILEDPYRFKPLGAPLQNKHRVHILKSFVLVYEILERERTVKIYDLDHHDNVYKT